MTKVQLLAREVKKLDRSSLKAFRNWFQQYDSDAWDLQIQKDAHSGKLGKFSKEALAALGGSAPRFRAGRRRH